MAERIILAEASTAGRPVPRRTVRCRRARARSGRTLIEALVAVLLSLFIGSALLGLMQANITARSAMSGQNASARDTRRTLDTIADHLRTAQMVTGVGAFSAASASSVTMYTNSAGTTTARYWLDTTTTPASLKQTVSGVTTVLLTDVQSLQFTYYVDSSSNFTSASAQWATTASASAPIATEIPNIGAVGITVTTSNNGVGRTLTTLVRLRNSPAKPHI